MPLIRVAVHGVSMDLAMLQRSNAIHISIKAERGTMDDLRLMYRRAPMRLGFVRHKTSQKLMAQCTTVGVVYMSQVLRQQLINLL